MCKEREYWSEKEFEKLLPEYQRIMDDMRSQY